MRLVARWTFHLPALLILGWFAVNLPAQTLTVLHTFGPTTLGVNSDGVNPSGGLILSGNTLYGTASEGGLNASGTVFSISTTGTNYTVLHQFGPEGYLSPTDFTLTNVDGSNPSGVLALSGNTLYGYASAGGYYGNGTIFSVSTGGSNFTVLHIFSPLAMATNIEESVPPTNYDGAGPSGLIAANNVLYGTAETGGLNTSGTLFTLSTNLGGFFTVLHAFTTTYLANGLDGGEPVGSLWYSNNMIYGVAEEGGANGSGTVYAATNNGPYFVTEHSFAPLDNYVSYEGGTPLAGVVLSGNTLYGSANQSGTNSSGTLFSVEGGSNYVVLHTFSAATPTNADGSQPLDGFQLSGNTLYGTAEYAGVGNSGTVFSLDTSGSNFVTLHSFAPLVGSTNADGRRINGNMVLSGNTLYGTAYAGGTNGNGTVFALTLASAAPQLEISDVDLAGTNLVINAVNGVNGGGYAVLMSTNVALPLNQWTLVASNALHSSGNFSITVTNTVNRSVSRRFYILKM